MWIFIVGLALIIGFAVIRYVNQRRYLKTLTSEQFREGYRKAQLIDVREPNEFKAGHILGARNIPVTQLKQRLQEIRPDKPVYLYCQNQTRSSRAANVLHKKGYDQLHVLQGGFKKWDGKIKQS
ncbi:rhodanese-like domain-containing protein [Pontibacillus yanchengensis]|uniref:Rhodanese-like domain-containing protein n=2 Tax=Pontibacillus yanchengensis TaxID=462910 RepID=A0ACC7VH72_9BACI|nr:rhodanese-like domain-containing protein [Pontibacillus yanchengensis]MYL33501.1 rhodanese-like domain-containing protein [Pontibacillus yanchengensis]MYL53551.1 rhodanese-like domain-containing protein [Pontibacillus yanchengensis]